MKLFFKSLLWGIKQLIPLKYHSEYILNGKYYVTTYRMWFGKCFDIKVRVL